MLELLLALVPPETWYTLFTLAVGIIGFEFSKSNQNSTSYSGLRGTPQFDAFAKNYGNTAANTASLANQYAASPFGYFQGKSVNELAPVSQYGLAPELTGALTGVANQLYSKASAGGAAQGMLSPENTSGIVGSSLNNIGQFLTPYIQDYAKYRQQLPEQLMASRLGFLQNTLGSMGAGLGSQSSYTGESMGFGAQGVGAGGSSGKGP